MYVGSLDNDPSSTATLGIDQNAGSTKLTGTWVAGGSDFTFSSGSLSGSDITLDGSTNTQQLCPPSGATVAATLQSDKKTLKGTITCGSTTDNFTLFKQ